MKTGIDKSKVMKRAWNIFRGNTPFSYSFSAALRRAWEVEKANIEYTAKKEAEETERARLAAWQASDEYKTIKNSNEYRNAWSAGIASEYANARPGQYFGD